MRFNDSLPLLTVYSNSIRLFKSKVIDNKKKRSKIDVVSAKIITKNNFEYDRRTKTWKQSGRSSKLVLEIKTEPESYEKIDTINTHIYPIIFEFKDLTLGVQTPFKWRDGSQKKPIFKLPGKKSSEIANINILNKVQMQFFFEMEFIAKINNVLWGVCRANRPPKKTNPKSLLYFTKHDIFVLEKIIIPFLNSGKGLGGFTRPVKSLNNS